jgi:hypothetical protein
MICLKDRPDLICSSILASAQISHFICRTDHQVIQTMLDEQGNDFKSKVFCTGIPQSLYLFECIAKNKGEFKVLPFFSPCLLVTAPEMSRSRWFYESTFIGQRHFYEHFSCITKKTSDFISPEIKLYFLESSKYLIEIGKVTLKNDISRFDNQSIYSWLRAESDRSVFSKIVTISVCYIKYWFFRVPLSLIRIVKLLVV